MNTGISSARMTVPKTYTGEIIRQSLIGRVQSSYNRLIYIHAGAGYGKTTFLSQFTRLSENTVWLTLAGEDDPFEFVSSLCEAVRHTFPDYDFSVSEYFPFANKENFLVILADALIVSFERLGQSFALILDDLHTVRDRNVKRLIACFLKYVPESIRVLMGSRETLWTELTPLYLTGDIFQLSQTELTFSREEMTQILGFEDNEIYSITEGWPLAIGSFRLLLENGVKPSEVPAMGKDALYAYLFVRA